MGRRTRPKSSGTVTVALNHVTLRKQHQLGNCHREEGIASFPQQVTKQSLCHVRNSNHVESVFLTFGGLVLPMSSKLMTHEKAEIQLHILLWSATVNPISRNQVKSITCLASYFTSINSYFEPRLGIKVSAFFVMACFIGLLSGRIYFWLHENMSERMLVLLVLHSAFNPTPALRSTLSRAMLKCIIPTSPLYLSHISGRRRSIFFSGWHHSMR